MLGSSECLLHRCCCCCWSGGVGACCSLALGLVCGYFGRRTEYSRFASGQARSTPVCLYTVALAIRPCRVPACAMHSRPAAFDHMCAPTNAAAGSIVSQGQVAASALAGQPCFICRLVACVLQQCWGSVSMPSALIRCDTHLLGCLMARCTSLCVGLGCCLLLQGALHATLICL